MDLKVRIGVRVKLLRERRKLTQAKLAEEIGVSPDAISQFERGITAPSFVTLDNLSRALNVPVRDFFDVDDVDASPRRIEAITTIMDIARGLSDADLEVARRQLEALQGRRSV